MKNNELIVDEVFIRRVSSKNSNNEKSRSCSERFSKFWTDFSSHSSIHGVQYIGQRHWIESLFWILALLVSLTGCTYLISNIYEKRQSSPVIVSFNEKSTPVWQIPFPAVTICPETKALNEIIDFTKWFHLANESELPEEDAQNETFKMMEAMAHVCEPSLFMNMNFNSGIPSEDITETLFNIAPDIRATLDICRWKNKIVDCNELFIESITDEGCCYTFNSLVLSQIYTKERIADDFLNAEESPSNDWNLNEGYTANKSETFPRRVLGSGTRASLIVVFRLYQKDLDKLCRGAVQGFKVLLHSPNEIPKVATNYYSIALKQEVILNVKPSMITTSDKLKSYDPEIRQCFFEGEKKLKFFKAYTQNNCEIECLTNFTLETCNCVKYSMPRESGTKICGRDKIECYNDAEDKLIETKLKEGLKFESSGNGCDCKPFCTSVHYNAEISQTDFFAQDLTEAIKDSVAKTVPPFVMSKLKIFFKEPQFITSKRSELYGLSEFLANCGGILGVFMGVSILSLIEIIYFTAFTFFKSSKKIAE